MQLFAPPKFDPRYYQQEAVGAIRAQFELVDSTLLVMATGLGKTVVFAILAALQEGRVLVLSHRDELVTQAKAALERATGEWAEREKAKRKAGLDTRLVSGSVQSLRGDRLKRFPRDHFKLIIVDEGHHGTAPTYRAIVEWFQGAKVLYVTATPDRGDGTAMGLVAETVAYKMDILDGITAGYLVPLADGYGRRIYLDEINLEGVREQDGDFAAGQLDKAMVKAAEGIVRETIREAGDRPTIGFMPGVRTAQYASEKWNALRPGTSIFIYDKTPPTERERLVREFKAGKYQVLWNCGIATEGFDAPHVSCIAIGRLTKSRNLYAQMTGRGTRPEAGLIESLMFDRRDEARFRQRAIAESGKPNMLLLDFVGNSGQHELVGPEDILGGNWTPEEKKLAKKKAKDGCRSTREALEAAREELRKLAVRQNATVKSRTTLFDPFKLVGIRDMDKHALRAGHKPMFPSTRYTLLNQPFYYPPELLDGLDRAGGEKLLRKARERLKKGLASYPQMKALSRYGINDPTLSRARASKGLSYATEQNGFHRPVDVTILNEILYGMRQPGEEG